ncbi:hypothetical protein C5167_040764 [Papaver somniferum]|uniref:Ion transport domain-containing protein n=1 Tax=Papaver somniferum TaxID=3469 RepID=A0A4Y7IK35_PAPSO|nr:hypothetical protein C5167_040764 [Papaver somniferum]
MDKPLLIDVQGEGDGSTSNGRRNSIPFRRRRFNAISHGSSYERAVALVVLAEDGIGLPEQVLESEDYGKAAKIYFIFIWFNPLWFLNLFSLLLLNFLEVVFLLILAADVVVYALLPVNSIPLRVAPYIRVVFVILNLGTQQGRTTFYSFGVTMYQMFLLFNRSNDPDVWIPAYKESRWYSLFFILYILLGVFFLSNLILAVVYDRFKAQLAGQVAKKDKLRTRILTKAFNLIDTDMESMITKGQLYRLIEELNKFRSLPKIENEEVDHIFKELDDSQDFKINLEEFWKLSNAIAFKFKKAEVPSWFDYYPNFYNSHLSKKLKGFVRSSKFGYIVFFFLLLNVVAVIIETTLDLHNRSVQRFWQEVEYIFGLIYLLEMALKIFSYGFENYWSKGRNRFAFVITWIMVIGGFTALTFPDATFLSNGECEAFDAGSKLQKFHFNILHPYSCFDAISGDGLLHLKHILHSRSLGGLSTLAILSCNHWNFTLKEQSSPSTNFLDKISYLLFNFNDYPNGMVTLFNLLVMGFWEVLMQGYKELTGTSWSLVYFISFYVITVLLLLNLVVAFVLEVFFSEIGNKEFQYSDDSSRGSSRKMQTRKAKVDALLHRILEPQIKSPEFCLDDCV